MNLQSSKKDQLIKTYFDNWTADNLRAEKATIKSNELAPVLSLIVDNSSIELPNEINQRVLTLLGR